MARLDASTYLNAHCDRTFQRVSARGPSRVVRGPGASPDLNYSALKATVASSAPARLAGTRHAARPTSVIVAVAPANAIGSSGSTPRTTERRRRSDAAAASSTSPTAVTLGPSTTTSLTRRPRLVPRAVRSQVRVAGSRPSRRVRRTVRQRPDCRPMPRTPWPMANRWSPAAAETKRGSPTTRVGDGHRNYPSKRSLNTCTGARP
jgi:hypothetical protein